MTNDEIINLAIENTIHGLKFDEEGLLRFAALVASAEREACAKLCEELSQEMPPVGEFASKACAKFIRGQA